MEIGPKIKQLRVQRGITLTGLAKRIKLTTSFLSQLERNLTSPSVSSLEKIAAALNVKIADFFQEGEEKDLIIVRRGAGRQAADNKHKVLIETLASGVFDVNINSQLFSLGANAEVVKELVSFHGEKFIMVFKGTIKLFSGKEEFVFKEGDSIYCAPSKSPYKIINTGNKEAKVLYVSFLGR